MKRVFNRLGHWRRFSASLLLLCSACGGADSITPTPTPARLTLSAAQAQLVRGDTLRLTASVVDSRGAPLSSREVRWESSDASVVQVSGDGLVTAVSVGGPASITATLASLSAVAQVTVLRPPVASVRVAPESASIVVGKTLRLEAIVRDARGTVLTDRLPTWTSDDPTSITVSSSGVVTALRPGARVRIVASTEGQQGSATVTSREPSVAQVAIRVPLSDVNEPASMALTAVATDGDGNVLTGRPVSWSSDTPDVAAMDADGTFRSRRAGTARVRARVDGVEGMATIAVRGLRHRWTFSEEGSGAVQFADDIGGKSATLVQVGAADGSALIGQVMLTGGDFATADYVSLPPGLLRTWGDATIEVWATVHSLKRWGRIFDVGSGPANNLFMAWSQEVNSRTDRAAFTVNGVEARLDNSLAPYTLNLRHHIVMAIDENADGGSRTRVSLFLDGRKRGSFETTARLRDLVDDQWWLGRSLYRDETANASYDEVRIHDRVYSDSYVSAAFEAGPVPNSESPRLILTPPEGMRDTVRGVRVKFPLRMQATDRLGRRAPVRSVEWRSLSPAVATIDSNGTVSVATPGFIRIEAVALGQTVSWSARSIAFEERLVHPTLRAADARALHRIPVIEVRVLPTRDGVRLDSLAAPEFGRLGGGSLTEILERTDSLLIQIKTALEEGSRYRGYANRSAPPSITLDVRRSYVYYGVPPAATQRLRPSGVSPYFIDHTALFSSMGVLGAINQERATQVWLTVASWDLNTPSITPAPPGFDSTTARVISESAMSNASGLCVSNSFFPDCQNLPRANQTYVMYGYNYMRGWSCGVHNHGHQFERIFGFFDRDALFWRRFVGQNTSGDFITGRTGWTHMPPNTLVGYDYQNTTVVASDIRDWRPDGGATAPINREAWENAGYRFPDFDNCGGKWLQYWMQNFPGRDNVIELGGRKLENWWDIYADFDAWRSQGRSLVRGASTSLLGSFPSAVVLPPVQPASTDYPPPPKRR